MQPDTDCGLLESRMTVEPSAPAPVNPGHPAAYFLLAFVIALAVFELWALATGHNTVSQLLQHVMKGRPWLFWVSVVGWAVLGWHLLKGFPW